jgi:hypothetical protein
VVLPALPALPVLLDVYQHGSVNPALIPLLRDAAKAVALTAGLSLALAALVLRGVEPRLGAAPRPSALVGCFLALALAVTALAGGALFVARHGGPVGFVDQRIEEFGRVGYPDLRGQGTRYGANVGSNRHDFWRVAVDRGLERPFLGGGGGSFQVAYLEHRRSPEAPEDPHSVEALLFSELGFPGLVLFLCFLVAAALAALRSRRVVPAATFLVAGALAAGSQWLAQASVDWLWNYPGVTAPAVFLLGVAAAPALRRAGAVRASAWRLVGAAVLLALAVLAVPLYLSGRYEGRARTELSADPRAAAADFGRAADLNPWLAQPLLAKAMIQARMDEAKPSLATLREAARREPSNYAIWLLIARQLVDQDPAAARRAARRARALNPHDAAVEKMWRRLASPPVG